MKRLRIQEALADLPGLIDAVRQEPIALTRRGKVCAAIVAMDESDFEAYSLAHNPKFVELIERSLTRKPATVSGVAFAAVLPWSSARLPRTPARIARSSW